MAHVSDHARIRTVLDQRGVRDLRQRSERVDEQQPVKAVVGGFKRGDDGGCQRGKLAAALPAGEQVDIAAWPVPHPVG
jgi:hypothetical protein